MRLNIKLFFHESLLSEPGRLDTLQLLLRKSAPKWSSITTTDSGDQVNLAADGSLLLAVQKSAVERGPTYSKLARDFGEGPKIQPGGVVELAGAENSIVVIVTSNADKFVPLQKGWRFGNSISVQLNAARIEGQRVDEWASKLFRSLCQALRPAWGTVHLREEYSMKNLDKSNGGIRAIGVDISRGLPGLYWLNYFGRFYQDLIGVERLATCPAESVEGVADGTLIGLSADPTSWSSPAYRLIEEKSRSHLGRDFFFERSRVEAGPSIPMSSY